MPADDYIPRYFLVDGEIRLSINSDQDETWVAAGYPLYTGSLVYDPASRVLEFNGRKGQVFLTKDDIIATGFTGAGGGEGGGDDSVAISVVDGRVTTEVTDRTNADTALGARIDDEVSNRTATDGALTTALSGKAAASHTHTAGQITDFTEAAQDAIAALLAGASGVSLSYDDAANTLTIVGSGGGTGLDAEAVRDAIGVAMIGTSPISVAINDGADTITISTTATVNQTDAYLLDRSHQTGFQLAATISDFPEAAQDALAAIMSGVNGMSVTYDDAANTLVFSAATALAYTDTLRSDMGTAITSITTSLTNLNTAIGNEVTARANADTALGGRIDTEISDRTTAVAGRAAASHTHTSAQITDFTEAAQDAIAALLAGASGVTMSYNDAANTLTVTGAGDTSALAEQMRDTIGVALIGSGVISVAVNDAADTITLSSTATANSTDAALRDRTTHTGAQAISTVTGLQAALDAIAGNATQVLTNKRITKRVYSTADTGTLTIASDDYDAAKVTALAQNLTIANPTGTPTDFQLLSIRITDAGVSKTLTWGSGFRAMGTALPTATTANKTIIVGLQWDSDDSLWNVLGVTKQP